MQAAEPIGLLGDYDVDGATSVALLARYLAAVGAPTAIDIPDRLREGYGPNAQALERLAAKGCRLVVTLDTGTTAFEPLARAAAQGQQIIVIDHHVAQAELPQAFGVINPNRRDQISAVGELAAVGVTFLAVVALNRTLRARSSSAARSRTCAAGWIWSRSARSATSCPGGAQPRPGRAGPAGRGTRGQSGLAALARAARMAWPPSAENCAFALGPRLNAGGRTGCSHLAAELLTSDAPDVVTEIALRLERLNETGGSSSASWSPRRRRRMRRRWSGAPRSCSSSARAGRRACSVWSPRA